MKVLDKIKRMKRTKFVSYILLLGIIVYGLSFSIIFITASNAFYHTIRSISIPDEYFITILDPENPEFIMSYRVENKGLYYLTEFRVNISMDLIYNNTTNNTERINIFSGKEKLDDVAPLQRVQGEFYKDNDSFNIVNLEYYWSTVANSSDTRFIFDFEIEGRYCLNLLYFSIQIDDFEFVDEECPNCGSQIIIEE